MEKLGTYEYGIPLLRVGHGQGPHIFTFLLLPLSWSFDSKQKRKLGGMKNSFFFQVR